MSNRRTHADAPSARVGGRPAAHGRDQITGHVRMDMGNRDAPAAAGVLTGVLTSVLTGVLAAVLCTGCTAAPAGNTNHPPRAATHPAEDTRPGAYPAGRPCPPTAHLPRPSSHAETAAGHTPDTAIAAWARMAYGIDTICDASPHDALVRSAALMAPGLARRVRRQRPVNAPGADWNRLAAHRAWTTVTTSPTGAERPADTPLRARRGVRIHSTAHGRDHWTGAGPEDVVYCTLTRPNTGAPWRISELSIQTTH